MVLHFLFISAPNIESAYSERNDKKWILPEVNLAFIAQMMIKGILLSIDSAWPGYRWLKCEIVDSVGILFLYVRSSEFCESNWW